MPQDGVHNVKQAGMCQLEVIDAIELIEKTTQRAEENVPRTPQWGSLATSQTFLHSFVEKKLSIFVLELFSDQ